MIRLQFVVVRPLSGPPWEISGTLIGDGAPADPKCARTFAPGFTRSPVSLSKMIYPNDIPKCVQTVGQAVVAECLNLNIRSVRRKFALKV